jgi:hypothetical protein
LKFLKFFIFSNFSFLKIFHFLDCKKIHHKENKIYEINKLLAEKYDESIKQKRSFKKMKRMKDITSSKYKENLNKENNQQNQNDRDKESKFYTVLNNIFYISTSRRE